MDIKKLLVVGAGLMGGGIAQVAACNGCKVLLYDVKEEFIERGLAAIIKSLAAFVAKGKMTEEAKTAALANISKATDLAAAAKEVDFAIEAVPEVFAIKEGVFQSLDKYCPPRTIIASNTSSLSISKLAAVTGRPGKVIGMHFFSPVPYMQLVELIKGLATSAETFAATEKLARELQKTPVAVEDYPGFAANRIVVPMINEAVYALMEGVASSEDIDTVCKLGYNHPLGPLQLADLIGLDVLLNVMEVLYEGYGDSKYRPCPLLKKYVAAGWLGRKSGRGFYSYEK